MKKLIWLIPFLILCSCSKKTSDLTEMNVKGDVKSIFECEYTAIADDEGVAKKGKRNSAVKCLFNKEGNLTEYDRLDEDGDTLQKVFVSYENDKVSKKIVYNEFGRLELAMDFSYDEKGRTKEILYTEANESVSKETFDYNDDNLIETVITFNPNGKIQKKKVIQKDKQGNPKEIKIFNEKLELVNYRKEIYDENKNLAEFTVYAADEMTILLSVKRTFDKAGNVLSQEAISETGEPYLPQTYKYKFDEKSNWIEGANYVGEEIQTLSEREIEYY